MEELLAYMPPEPYQLGSFLGPLFLCSLRPQPYEGQSGNVAGTQAGAHAKEAWCSCLETRTFPITEQDRKYRNLYPLNCPKSQVLACLKKGKMASPVDMLFLNTYFLLFEFFYFLGGGVLSQGLIM